MKLVEFYTPNDPPTFNDLVRALSYLNLEVRTSKVVWKSADGRHLEPMVSIIVQEMPIPQESADEHAESCGI